ncbi:Cof-type HAD-IIB family hydrolase [Levilactobacillus brevis]
MVVKLIATDLNGTLLHQDQGFNQPLLKETLSQLKQRGIRLVLASGNQYAHLKEVFREIWSTDLAVIAENGASIYLGDELVFDGSLTPQQVWMFLSAAAQDEFLRNAYLILVGAQGSYTKVGAPAPLIAAAEKFYDHLQQVMSLETVTDRIKKISVSTAPEQAAALVQHLNQRFAGQLRAHDSGYGVVDVVSLHVGKLPAVQWLAQHWQIPATEIVAFGDGANDVPLLNYVGQSYAMKNAPVDIQVQAKHVTVWDNDRDGVLRTIAALLVAD